MDRYLLKKRDALGLGNPQAFRGGKRSMSYGKWRTVVSLATLEEASKLMAEFRPLGMQQLAIFYKGKKMDSRG
jgi:hypothetical protein